MRQVERAIFDLRRGLPVVITGRAGWMLARAVETGEDDAQGELQKLAGSRPALLLARPRLVALGLGERLGKAEAGSLALPSALPRRRLAELAFGLGADEGESDLVVPGALTPAGFAERAALNMARRALLVPAVLSARVAHARLEAVREAVAEGELLAVPEGPAAECLNGARGRVRRVSEARVPLAEAAGARFVLFREPDGLREHVAVVIGSPGQMTEPVPVRLHSACLTGDLFGSLRCDCGEQLRNAVAELDSLGGGVLLYLAQEGRGIGLANKLRAYALQDTGLDTMDADHVLGFGEDERHYGVAVDMLSALGVRQAMVLTNNPDKLRALAAGGVEIAGRQALYGSLNDHNHRYLSAKAERAGHWLDEVLDTRSSRD
ncbi:GTP cyclohydrolase II [Ectothiorhodospiraceae bacterium WFHF3C12]|nr:GTP cyclohydrolase II [Ectothiorhodospiraceae bacterium WFHF3C12]